MSLVEPRVWRAIEERIAGGQEDAFMIIDLQDVESKIAAWKELLPRVEPFYAVKCHDDARIISRLAAMGVGFDCASQGEMRLVMDNGGRPEDIIYAHPCKPAAHVRYAEGRGVRMMTFDNHDELRKVRDLHPDAQMLLRLLPDDSSAKCQLGVKFGADMDAVPSLLQTAKDLGVDVIGVSYHVGSGCQDIAAFSDAVHLARRAFDVAAAMGFEFSILDIGGGFPGDAVRHWRTSDADAPEDTVGDDGEPGQEARNDARTFPDVARQLAPTLDQLFPAEEGVRIIAEPGRYMVHSCGTLVATVIGRRRTALAPAADESDDFCAAPVPAAARETVRYYINDGVYGSFNNIIYDHATPVGFPLRVVSSKLVPERRRMLEVEPEDTQRALSDPTFADDEKQQSDDSDADDVQQEQAASEQQEEEDEQEVHRESSVWGPTCDGLDCVLKSAQLPLLEVGDWMFFPDMGAYTVAAAAAFNGFEVSKKYYVD